jgi:hypothetical protein
MSHNNLLLNMISSRIQKEKVIGTSLIRDKKFYSTILSLFFST